MTSSQIGRRSGKSVSVFASQVHGLLLPPCPQSRAASLLQSITRLEWLLVVCDCLRYERKLLKVLEDLIREMDRKIGKNKDRAAAESAPKPIKPEDLIRLSEMLGKVKGEGVVQRLSRRAVFRAPGVHAATPLRACA